MATTMTWVHIPTKNVTLTIPNHTVNRQAIKEFANTVEEVENFMQNLSYIADQSYGAFIVENGSDILYDKMYELYDALRPTLDHFSELSQWFTNLADSLESSEIRKLCDEKYSNIQAKITNLASTCNGDERNLDASGKALLNSLKDDRRIIQKAKDGDYDG